MTGTLPAALAGQRIAVLDVEGDGGQPPEIIEIAVLTLDDDVTRENLRTWLVRPCQPITPLVTRKVHGISNADVAGSPAWAEIAEDIADLINGRTLVAHNASVAHKVLSAHLPALMLRTTLDPDIPLGDNKERDDDTDFRILADHYVNQIMHELRLPHELLPADGHDQALSRALAFATACLAGRRKSS